MSVKNAPDRASASSRTTSNPSVPIAAPGANEVKAQEGLPAGADAARALRDGTQRFQKGQDKDGNPAAVWLTRKGGDTVEVTVTRGAGENAKQTTYLLDLKQADARAAYEDLTKFRTMRADLMGEKPKKTGVQVKAKGSAKKAKDAATGAKGYEGNGSVTLTQGDAKATVTASGKRVKTSTQKDGLKTAGKALEGSVGVSVEKKPASGAQVKGGASVAHRRAGSVTQDAQGQVTGRTQERSTTVAGDARVTDAKSGSTVGTEVKRTQSSKIEENARGERTETRTSVTQAGVDGKLVHKSGESTTTATVDLDWTLAQTDFVGPDGQLTRKEERSHSLTTTADATVKTGDTTATAKLSRKESQTSTGDAAGLRQQQGTLGQEIDLTASFQGGRKVGFEKDGAREYVLTLPAGSTGTPALPLDHRAALALPEGAAFALTAKGKVGIQGEADGFQGGISQERQVEVKIERKGGSVVAASVSLGERQAGALGFQGKAGDEKGLHGTFSASHKDRRADARQDQLQLDLAVPEHQAAYDALLRGNLAPAQAIAARAGQSTETSARGNEQAAKLGIAFGKLGASAELFRKDLDPSDPAIQKDPARAAISAAAQKDGRELRWIERGGAVEVGGGFSGGVAPGAAGFSFGFEGKGALEWRSIGPREGGEGGAPGVVLRADEALAMAPGSEFALRGQAKISGRVGAIGGWHLGAGPVQVNAGVSFDASKSKVMDLGVRVKRLQDGTVEVRMDELDQSRHGLQLAARLGVDISGAELAASGGSLLAALAKRPDAAEKLAQLQKHLSAEFKLGTQWTKEEGKGLVFQLDLQKPEARRAYEQLVRGDADGALELAANSQTGVQLQAHSQLVSEGKSKEVSLRLGNNDLYVNKQSRTDSTAEVTTKGDTERLDRTTGAREKSSIFGRRRALELDAVSLRTDRAPAGEKFLRLSYEEKDKYTSSVELKQRRALAASLGATPVRPEVVGEDKGGGILKVLSFSRNDHGKVQTNIDVYLTSAGIQQIRNAGREGWLRAYGDAIQEMHGRSPAWNDPDRGARARDLLEQYRRAEGVVDRIERDRPFGNDDSWERREYENKRWDAIEHRDTFRKAYEREFGKDQFKKDVKDFARAAEFADAMERSSDDVDPAAWNRSFGDLAETMGFNIFDTVAAMNRLAGADDLVVGRFAMKGKVVDIEMQSEGVVAAPRLSGEAPQTLDQARKAAQAR